MTLLIFCVKKATNVCFIFLSYTRLLISLCSTIKAVACMCVCVNGDINYSITGACTHQMRLGRPLRPPTSLQSCWVITPTTLCMRVWESENKPVCALMNLRKSYSIRDAYEMDCVGVVGLYRCLANQNPHAWLSLYSANTIRLILSLSSWRH